jgi:hypothetical protein
VAKISHGKKKCPPKCRGDVLLAASTWAACTAFNCSRRRSVDVLASQLVSKQTSFTRPAKSTLSETLLMTKTGLGSIEIDTCCITGALPNRARPRLWTAFG